MEVTLPETNSSPLKMDDWITSFLLGRPIFRGYVSFREGSNYIVSKLAYNLFTELTTYLYTVGVIIHLPSTMDIPVNNQVPIFSLLTCF